MSAKKSGVRETNRKLLSNLVVTHDEINHPKHYNQGNIEVIDFITDQGLNFEEGSAVKYIARWRSKGGTADLRKAVWYLNNLIKRTEAVQQ